MISLRQIATLVLALLLGAGCRGMVEPAANAAPAASVNPPVAQTPEAVQAPEVSPTPAWDVTAIAHTLEAHAADDPSYYDQSEPAPPPAPSIDVVIISDLNSGYGSMDYRDTVHRAIAEIVERRPDLVLVTGDMVAGQRRGLDYRGMWRAFHEAVTDPLTAAGIPLAVTPGNHDGSEVPAFAHERDIFVDEWRQRRPEVRMLDDENYPLRYAFAMGPGLFVSLDATWIGPLPDEQMAWLDHVLSEYSTYPVKVVYGHMPLYPFATVKRNEVIGDPALEQLLVRHGVTAMISGHHHAWYPGRRDTLRLVGMPCLGTGARSLLGEHDASPQAFASFRITPDGMVDLDAWTGDAMRTRVDRETLPPTVGEGTTLIVRDDL